MYPTIRLQGWAKRVLLIDYLTIIIVKHLTINSRLHVNISVKLREIIIYPCRTVASYS